MKRGYELKKNLCFGGDNGGQFRLHLVWISKLGQIVVADLQASQEFPSSQEGCGHFFHIKRHNKDQL